MHKVEPVLQRQLFDTVVSSILRYACEVWAIDENVGQAAEQVHTTLFSNTHLAAGGSKLMQLSFLTMDVSIANCW